MSELLVNTIKKADGTGSLSVPAESGTVVTTASPSLGRRNLIINGAMQVAQRGTSFSAAGYTLDRMRAYLMQSGGATYTQSTDAPSGFKNSLKVEVTTAVTSPNSTDYSMMRQLIEAQNCIPQLSWGTSDADSITISFWVKSSITGDFGIALHNENFNYSYADLYTINAVDTWEYKTVTITGATAGAWNTGNDIGIVVNFSHGSGSGRQITTGSWTGSGALGASGETNLYATVGNTWQITGVQLEVGSVATPFEHRSFGEELALCQRYFERFDNTRLRVFMEAATWTGTEFYGEFKYAEKRTAPTLSQNTGAFYLRGFFNGDNGLYASGYNSVDAPQTLNTQMLITATTGSATGGEAGWWRINDNGYYLDVDAEL